MERMDYTGFEGTNLRLSLPSELESMAPHLLEFFQGMVAKLYQNRHKTPPRKCDLLKFLLNMHQEMVELHEQCYLDPRDPNMFLEMHDVANYAFLMSMALRLELIDAERRVAAITDRPPVPIL